jgi:hypothetical protein
VSRPDFPLEAFAVDEACPHCHALDSIQANDHPIRFWKGAQVIDGTLSFGGLSDTTEDGTDEHLDCISCGAEWAMPPEVDYR